MRTSWGKFSKWYSGIVEEKESYQQKVLVPNVLRLLELKRGEDILDLGCGEGMFAREFQKTGANVVGLDIAPELITIAKKKSSKEIVFHVANAKNLSMVNDHVFDAVVMILTLQNIDDMASTLREVRRVIKPTGKLLIVLNHPVLRIPKLSGWGWDEGQRLQYRRVNGYMSEIKIPIQMHPGDAPGDTTWSFHRPLQTYIKALADAGFYLTNLEEWTSHKKSQRGPRAKAEDRARLEIPMFMAIVARPTIGYEIQNGCEHTKVMPR